MKRLTGLLMVFLLILSIASCAGGGAGDDGGGGGAATPVDVVFMSVSQSGGTSGTMDSTGLVLFFDADPATLTADDITVTGALKGVLSGSGTTRTLAISNITVADGETVSVEVASPSGYSISGSPQTAVVFKAASSIIFQNATQTGGTSGTIDSTGLILSFDADPTTLTAGDISITGATKGALSGTGTTRTLGISDITVANGESVSVTIASPSGYSISGSPKTAVVYRYNAPVTFTGVTQAGGTSGTIDSTALILSFDADPTTLTADDISVTGATKGSLTGSGTTRTLGISNITVANGESVSVTIANPAGYSISGSPQTAVVYRELAAVSFLHASSIGGPTTGTTGLQLIFDVNPTTLTTDDITLTGATKGALSGSGTTRTLAISNITVANGETVSVSIASPSGFILTGSPKTAVVYLAPTAVSFISAVQTGGASYAADSTALTLTFDIDPTTLTADDISLTGASKGALTGSGTTRSLAISNISVLDGETVSVTIYSPVGYSITGSPKTAVVYREPFIGMPYQGGVIAYILQSGDPGYVSGEIHGLIAATEDQSTSIRWLNSGIYTTTGATGEVLGTGQANTTTIINNQGAGSYAAQVCNDYVSGIYSDWYLPSKDELNKLYLNRAAIGGFASGNYWSSTESSLNYAWIQYFGVPTTQGGDLKEHYLLVRAVRSF